MFRPVWNAGESQINRHAKRMIATPFSTSAFAPKHYPKAIIDFANTRGADKMIFAGYWPMGLSLERIRALLDPSESLPAAGQVR